MRWEGWRVKEMSLYNIPRGDKAKEKRQAGKRTWGGEQSWDGVAMDGVAMGRSCRGWSFMDGVATGRSCRGWSRHGGPH